MKKISIIIMMLLFSISIKTQTLINLNAIKGGVGGQIPYSTTTGTLTTLTSSTSLTYSNSIFKINAQNLPSGEATGIQLGTDILLIGNKNSAAFRPSFVEFLKPIGSGSISPIRGSAGFLGSYEMNQSVNMDYTTGSHKYYDTTTAAAWTYLGYANGFGLQYVPANNPNSNIYVTYGCRPFKFDIINQPTTGKGIDGFSRLTTAQINLVDATNTATVTKTTYSLTFSGGSLNQTGLSTFDTRLNGFQGNITYNTNTLTATDLNLMTPFGLSSSGTAINALSYSTTTGYHTGIQGLAEDGNVNVGVIGKAVKQKASTTNIGLLGVASNTNATSPIQIGGFFGLTGIADALPASLTSAALMADNGTSTSNILTLRDNGSNVLQVLDGGIMVMGNTVRLKSYTVATLPTGVEGDLAYVTDANAPIYNATVSGGGSTKILVFYNGTNWTCH